MNAKGTGLAAVIAATVVLLTMPAWSNQQYRYVPAGVAVPNPPLHMDAESAAPAELGLLGGLCRSVTDIPRAIGRMLDGFFHGQKESLPKADREEPQYRYFPNASGVIVRVPVQ